MMVGSLLSKDNLVSTCELHKAYQLVTLNGGRERNKGADYTEKTLKSFFFDCDSKQTAIVRVIVRLMKSLILGVMSFTCHYHNERGKNVKEAILLLT